MTENAPPQTRTLLILSLVLPFSAAFVFGALALLVPIEPAAPNVSLTFLIGAVGAGIIGPGIGKLLRPKPPAPSDYVLYLRQLMPSVLIGLAIRESGVIFAALYVHSGGALLRGLAVAGIIVLSMLLDVKTPARLRAEYEATPRDS